MKDLTPNTNVHLNPVPVKEGKQENEIKLV